MDRRTFVLLVQAMVAGNALAAAKAGSRKSGEAVKKKRMVVVGAGLSGLAAARHLQALGHEVIVVEGRQRLGGRIHTSALWQDLPMDLGASWIHGMKGNPLTKLSAEINARLIETSYGSSIAYRTDGGVFTDVDEGERDKLSTRIKKILRAAQDAEDDVSIATAVHELFGKESDPKTARLARFIFNGDYELEYAGSIREMSAHWFDNVGEFGGKHGLFADGFEVLVKHLAEGLKVEFGQTVKAITWNDEGASVETPGRVFTADRVLITLPLGVLKAGTVAFAPGLPVEKREAIERLGMGVLNKCVLRFPHAFWPCNVDWLEYVSETHGEWTQWVSFLKAANKPVLLGFKGADTGLEMEKLTDEAVVASAMKVLRTIFGPKIPEPDAFQVTRWASDPFAFGSYSFNALGSRPAMREALAKPIGGRIFFAGEATEKEHFATAHGAYLSGLRAGREMAGIS